ncbi:MAG: cytochrome C [Verrucomicrobia bacterium]|nr:cytochrome C [Verrucomicrobiota bacterium]
MTSPQSVPTSGHGFRRGALIITGLTLLAFPSVSHALPSYARQTNMQCIACHSDFPVLNDMGRQFKLSGYTMGNDQSSLPPIAVMLQPSYTHTQAKQPGDAAPGFKSNDNYAMSQVSLFYAGRLFGPYASRLFDQDTASFLNKIGVFSQTTYDGVAKTWAWDNTEIRYADVGTVADHATTYGVYLNNNPTMQDPWNTTPVWGFPFSGSGLAPTPAAATLINGGLGGQVIGLGAYAMFDSHVYVDVGLYRTLGAHFQHSVGVDPTGEAEISGLAPYWRIAYTQPVDGATWEIGLFGMSASTRPGRNLTAGTDRITDFGIDSQIQKSSGAHDITGLLSVIYERANWDASQALGNTTRASDSLTECKATVDYLWDKTYGGAVQYFATRGTSDALAYSSSVTGSPNSNGFVLEANYLPFNKSGGPSFWPKSSVKLSLQYVIYNRFDGSTSNIDGTGRSASDNNTLYLQAWIVF